jgi:iron(III) transport system ATP-binding protein
MTGRLWRLENVYVAGTVRPRLDGITLDVAPGTTAVLGISGAGKTTFLNLLCGFGRPHRGRVEHLLPQNNDRVPLFWVPQNDGLWPHRTVREHVAEVLPAGLVQSPRSKVQGRTEVQSPRSKVQGPGLDDKEIVPRASGAPTTATNPLTKSELEDAPSSASRPWTLDLGPWTKSPDEWLSAFDLLDHADKTPEQLSHGERNRLAVARALASGAGVLVMDEPMAHVDPARINDYWRVIREHCSRTGTSLIVATHSPEVALAEAENAVCFRDGRVVYHGPIQELYHAPRSQEEASLLGPGNWFTQSEAAEWLGITLNAARCYRPEQLAIWATPDGPYLVEESRFAGAFAEVTLTDERAPKSRRFYHRPAGSGLKKGIRVALRVIALLLVCFLASACDERDQPKLNVRDIHYWSMPPKGAMIPAPRSVTVGPHNEVLVLDKGGRVIVFSQSGEILKKWNMPDARIGNPEGACFFADGRIAVADTHYSRVVFFDQEGKVVGMLGSEGPGPGQFHYPICVSQDPKGNFYVGEYGGNDRVQKFSVDGKFLLQVGKAGSGPGQFQRASGVVWHDGLLYIADSFNNRVQVFTDTGTYQSIIGLPESGVTLGFPYALALGPQNDLFVIEYMTARVSRFDLKTKKLLGRFGRQGRGEGEFSTPWGIDVNSKGTVYVADTDNRRLVELLR